MTMDAGSWSKIDFIAFPFGGEEVAAYMAHHSQVPMGTRLGAVWAGWAAGVMFHLSMAI